METIKSSLSIQNCRFDSCKSGRYGGGMHLYDTCSTSSATVTECVFYQCAIQCSNTTKGGGLYAGTTSIS